MIIAETRRWSDSLVAAYVVRPDEPWGVFVGSADDERSALRIAKAAASKPDCVCGHSVFIHLVGRRRGSRGACTHHDARTGECRCCAYQACSNDTPP